MKKRILTFVLSLVMILSCVMTSAVVVSAEDKITATENWYDEDATKLYISSPEDLLAFASVLYDGHSTGKEFEGKTVYLTKDITLNTGDASKWGTTAPTNKYNSFKGGSSTGWFKGTFDGQGYVISGLYSKNTGSGAGFIPYASESATIKNVTIRNSYFECAKTDGGLASAIMCEYKAPTAANSCLTVENVHIEDTYVIGNYGVAGVLAFMNAASVTGIKINMNNITFVGGGITGGRESGGVIGKLYQGTSYDYGVELTMNKIVVNTNMTFTNTTEESVRAGGVIGYLSGFRSATMKNIMIGGSLTIVGTNTGSTPFVGEIKSTNCTITTVDENTVYSVLDITNALAAPQMTNVQMYLCYKSAATGQTVRHPEVKMTNIRSDQQKVTTGAEPSGRKTGQGGGDVFPDGGEHKFNTADLIGKQLFDGWMVADETSYPVPTANSVRLIGYQSSYATDVKDANNDEETYSIRLIAALNDTFYTTAGFEGISISYVKAGETEPTVVPKDAYTCKYAYKSVKGVDKTGAVQTYAAGDYYADALIALEITGIPEDVTTFTITLNAFAGKDDVTFDGITRTVQISAQ